MVKVRSISHALKVSLVASAFLCLVSKAVAIPIDPFAFCANSCKPGPCDKAEIKADCQKACKDGGVWKHVASLQMRDSSKEFRTEKDQGKKAGMLYKAPIAQCLGLVAKEPEKKAEAKPLAPAPLPSAPTGGMTSAPKISDLCAAAIRKEMGSLQSDIGSLQTQNKDLKEALSALEAAPAS